MSTVASIERDRSMDVAKGILALLVLYLHWPCMSPYPDPLFSAVLSTKVAYISFFMPAFFVITGLFSNFSLNGSIFVKKNLLSLLLPALTLDLLCALLMLINYKNTDPMVYVNAIFGRLTAFLDGSRFWFLDALLISKLIYWLIHNYLNKYKLVISIAIMFIGVCGNNYVYPTDTEPWSIWHAFTLLPFLWLGQRMRTINLSKKMMMIALLVYAALIACFFDNIPSVTQIYILQLYQVPLWLALSVSGTLALIGISKSIKACSFLEFFGRNSLIVYCFSFDIFTMLYMHTEYFFNKSLFMSAMGMIIVLLIAVLVIAIGIHLLNRPYFSWMLGKSPSIGK